MYVYIVTDLTNEKQYVGASTKPYNSSYLGSGRLIKEAIKRSLNRHENFKKKLLEECDNKCQLNEREDFWIKKLNTLHPNGYNISRKGKRSKLQQNNLGGKYKKLLTQGKRFGSWVIVGAICRDVKSRVQVFCRCDCGFQQLVYANQLVNQKTTQCKKCSSGKTNTTKALANKVYRRILGAMHTSSISPTNILKTYQLQNSVCALTGQKIATTEAAAIRWDGSEEFNSGNTLITTKTMVDHMSGLDGKTFVNLCQSVINNVPKNNAVSIKDFFDRRENQ